MPRSSIALNQSGNYTGNLQLIPYLLQSGETTQVHWNVSNAQSCTVTSTNGDSWTGPSSPTNGETSKPITSADHLHARVCCLWQ